jgi:carbonic anhydrase
MLESNAAVAEALGPDHFKRFADAQTPVATVVACSDSRVHLHSLNPSPDNRLFVVRNIGNQIATSEGSVEYGVRHLHTPFLLVLGHGRCGAIQAALGEYWQEPPAIWKEIDALKLEKGSDWLEAVRANVHRQVGLALEKFGAEVSKGLLTVVGAIYDFADDLGRGHGRITIINVNGEKDPGRIEACVEGDKR